MHRTKISIVLIVALIVAGFLLIKVAAVLAPKTEKIHPDPVRITVNAIELNRQDVVENLRGFGLAQPIRRAQIPAQIPAMVDEVLPGIRVGASVEKGQRLAVLDSVKVAAEVARRRAVKAELEAQQIQNRAELEENRRKQASVEKDVELARQELARIEDLFKAGVTSVADRDNARGALQAAEQRLSDIERSTIALDAQLNRNESMLTMRQQELQIAEADLGYAVVEAPFKGIIEKRMIDDGDYVSPGMAMFSIVDMTAIELPIEVPASQAAALREGAPALLMTEDTPPQTAIGKVERISPTIDPETRTVGAYVVMENNENTFNITPGLFLSARVKGRTFEDVISIPRAAIVDGSIFIAKDGAAQQLTPDFFEMLDAIALTRDDIPDGTILITSGFERLYNGAPVTVEMEDGGSEYFNIQEALEGGEINVPPGDLVETGPAVVITPGDVIRAKQ